MKQSIWITMMTIGLAVPATAQTDGRKTAPQDDMRQEVEVKIDLAKQMVGTVRAKMAVEARTTPGRPYSGEAVTESTQVLADGNRIARKSVTRIYRDTEGRTRREQINDSGVVESVSVVDPVARTSFVLQPETRTAYREGGAIRIYKKMVEEYNEIAAGRSADEEKEKRAEMLDGVERAKVERAKAELEKQGAHVVALPRSAARGGGGRGAIVSAAIGETVREELGTQSIDGITAAGTRTTTTIPAGAIGNLQPIKVVSEQWFSAELQVLVLTKHSDPRSGDTTYRLVNIVRAEPDRSLFTMPPDYTIKEGGIREPLE